MQIVPSKSESAGLDSVQRPGAGRSESTRYPLVAGASFSVSQQVSYPMPSVLYKIHSEVCVPLAK